MRNKLLVIGLGRSWGTKEIGEGIPFSYKQGTNGDIMSSIGNTVTNTVW